jgi:hypothetical protein
MGQKTKNKSKVKTQKINDSQLIIRLDKDMRNEFIATCKELDTSASRELRRFIKIYMRQYHSGEFDE